MDLGLKGRSALVTGSTAGIGFAAARALAREGAHVIVNGRSAERVAQAVERIRADAPGSEVRGAAADLSTAAGVEQLIAQVGPALDILVNNAGIFEPKPFEDIPDEEWFRFFETNVMSGVRLARAWFPGMLARNSGRILFVSSESARQIPVEMIHYGMTKSAQLAIARGLAERTRGTNVTVNSVLPGPTSSEGVSEFVRQMGAQRGMSEAEMEREFFASARPSSLLQRFITPDEVANMIVYLASDAASATSGSSVLVDGGVVRSVT